jgi:hypothetical protein
MSERDALAVRKRMTMTPPSPYDGDTSPTKSGRTKT